MPPRLIRSSIIGCSLVLALIVIMPATGATATPGAPRIPSGRERTPPNEDRVAALLFPALDVEGLRGLGPEALPVMARLYEQSDPARRSVIAQAFYTLGVVSPDAKRVLMRDVHTDNPDLRLQVQWALGRVSGDPDVVGVLLANMQTDSNPLFRDKAACALAHDQIHLTEDQTIELFAGLIRALRDPKQQVREIAAKVLQIRTGQTKGFDPGASLGRREASIQEWERWLDEYRSHRSS